MSNKQLIEKAIDIKGKKYVLVSDRVLYFNEVYPNGSIVTERISEDWLEIVKATVTPDCDKPWRYFTGYSQAKWWDGFINKTSALENAETSAVWRSLAMMWIWVIDSIASLDEINKAENTSKWDNASRYQKALENTQFMRKYKTADEYIKAIRKWLAINWQQEQELRDAWESEIEFMNNWDALQF